MDIEMIPSGNPIRKKPNFQEGGGGGGGDGRGRGLARVH
jgi:hypothetical protein